MGSFNRATVVGNLGRDAELRYTAGGSAVANFSLATTENWKDKSGERKEQTEWHNVVVWGKQAEALAEYLKKGKQVLVEGRLQTRKWEDKDGNKRSTTEIVANRIVLLGGGSGGGQRSERGRSDGFDDAGSQGAAPADLEPPPGEPLTDDDIPF